MKKVIFIILLISGIIFFGFKLTGINPFASEASDQTTHNQASSSGNSAGDVGCDHAELLRVETPSSLSSQEKDYRGFRLSFNADNHTPNWVAWELLRSETDGDVARNNNFWQDVDMKGCPVTNDYKHSGYDRGHMCPAADNKWDATAMYESFLFTNICPQNRNLNVGDWNEMENQCRRWAEKYGRIYIVCGPILYKGRHKTIGKNKVVVPEAFFKVVLCLKDKPKAIGFIYKNVAGNRPKGDYVNSVDDVERITGLDFFSSLPDDIEAEIEATADYDAW